jgi:LmbE family N-acetylglucosaminyl deacetylase
MKQTLQLFLYLTLLISGVRVSVAQQEVGPNVLIVDAHPDDETGCAATVYKITHDMHGKVDLAIITNGEGGYKYSTLANAYYGLELTDEKVGREFLPTIRKNELMNAGKIIGLRNYFFFDQKDNRYMLNPHEVLDSIWDVKLIQARLHDILVAGKYDYIFCLLPVDSTHGHHKGATISALMAVKALGSEMKHPIVLGVGFSRKGDSTSSKFVSLKDYPITEINMKAPVFTFDRSMRFGYHNALSYKMVVNWEIAEHKSQGTMQMLGSTDNEPEEFHYFAINDPAKIAETSDFFRRLAVLHFVAKTY